MSDIDPRDFGRLEAEVRSLQEQVTNLNTKVDSLLRLANEGKGGIRALWLVGGVVASVISFIGYERLSR